MVPCNRSAFVCGGHDSGEACCRTRRRPTEDGDLQHPRLLSCILRDRVGFGCSVPEAEVEREACCSRGSGCGDSVGTPRGLMVKRGTLGLCGRRDVISPLGFNVPMLHKKERQGTRLMI